MSNSLTIQGSLIFQAPAGSQTVNEQMSLAATATPTGSALSKTIATISTTETTPATPGVTNLGYVFFRNLDVTNFVEIGSATGAYSAKLLPGDISLIKFDGANVIYARANTANVQLQIFACSL
jgi:hypothetical protein